ncbi:MAG: YARHG domain-containing protein [Beijerinckiaceae bacterium]
MRRIVLAAAAVASLSTSAALAGDGPEFWNCGELWQNRNQIYKDQGYCFKTARAIRMFGNAGCQYDNVEDLPLSANQRRDIRDIVRYERIRGCPR